jgi:hypothetical protein
MPTVREQGTITPAQCVGVSDRRAQDPASVVLPMERLRWLKHVCEGGHSPQARVL